MVMVEEIEAVIGRPIAECFDLVAGTSIGGCGALIISQFPAHGEAVRKARQAFYKCAPRSQPPSTALAGSADLQPAACILQPPTPPVRLAVCRCGALRTSGLARCCAAVTSAATSGTPSLTTWSALSSR